MSKPLAKLGAALDRDNYEWLQRENEELAIALENEVAGGADPEYIRRFMLRHVGENRQGLIARCVSAARHLQSVQVH